MKRLVLAFALLAVPVAAWAQCDRSDQQVMSCTEGSIWDPLTNACVPIVTG